MLIPPSCLWTPGQGPDRAALDRMIRAFPKPAMPMGEAWFMGDVRKTYPQLCGDLDVLPDEDIERAIEEIATGTSSFGPFQEWVEWYHYLLPRLVEREWQPSFDHPAELLITAFMAQHPASDGGLPYREFQTDALVTLGRYIMSPHFWPDGELDVANCLSKRTWSSGIVGWFKAGNLLSASLFFCIKYMPRNDVETWFRSVIAIPNRYWQMQVLTWLVSAHSILTGEIEQPSEFPEGGAFDVRWDWSHVLDGNYSGNHEPPLHLIPFLPAENRETIVKIARGMEVEEFLEDVWTDPEMSVVASEAVGMPERFLQLYRTDRPAGDGSETVSISGEGR
ncbi:MAG: hypothetical protein ABIS51_17330 [Sphingomonas sp.]